MRENRRENYRIHKCRTKDVELYNAKIVKIQKNTESCRIMPCKTEINKI